MYPTSIVILSASSIPSFPSYLTLMHCIQVALANSKGEAQGCKTNANFNNKITKGNKSHAIAI